MSANQAGAVPEWVKAGVLEGHAKRCACHSACGCAEGDPCDDCEGEILEYTEAILQHMPAPDVPIKLTKFRCDCGQLLLVEGQVIGKEARLASPAPSATREQDQR